MVSRFTQSKFGYAAGVVGLYAIGIAITALALYGCSTETDRIYTQAFGYQCHNADTSLGDVLCKNRPAGRGQEHVSRYCYKTIADSNCFDRPDQDRKNQALGSSGY
jgi:hypothetical protein